MVLDGFPVEIVGVMPASFGYPASGTEVYLPMGMSAQLRWEDRDSGFGMRSIARMKPGTSIEMTMEDLARVGRDVREEFGATTAVPEVRAFSDYYLGETGAQLWILMGAVAFVLLIATVNVGNLLLVRGEDRRAEIAVRTALGASRAAVLRHLIVEGLVLSVLGGIAGILLASLLIPLLTAALPVDTPVALTERIGLDGSVLLFTSVLMVATGVVFGVLPALRVSKQAPAQELRVVQRATDARGKRVRAGLVVVEVALATVLLVGAGLMLQSLRQLNNADKGFSEDGVLSGLVRQQFPDSTQWRAFYTELITQASALPGVRSVAASLMLPLSNRSWEIRIWPDGVPAERETGQSVLFGIITEDYFETLGVPLLAGRSFTPEDRDGGELVAIIDETMAEMFWPGEDPIGKRVTFETDRQATGDTPVRLYRTVVGVAKNVRHYELESPSRIQVYVPFTQLAGRWGYDMYVLLRTSVPPGTLALSLRSIARNIDSETPIADVQALREYVDTRMSGRRAVSGLLIAFGAVALGLAGIGVFGVISYSVSRQTREIGVRLALGAQARDVVMWVARGGLWIGIVGVTLGLAGAAALSRVLTGMLYQVDPVQLEVYASLGLVLIVLCVVASYLPALRATRIDPVTALRRE